MIDFTPDMPFPLLGEETHTYAEAQLHSRQVDEWLGLMTDETELKIKPVENQQSWSGLKISALMTPYTELRLILEKLKPLAGGTVVDLGAAYGRMGFVMERCCLGASFIGYGLDALRVEEGVRVFSKWELKSSRLIQADLSSPSFRPVDAAFYFIYDYGTRRAIEKTLGDLRDVSQKRAITVVGR